MLDYSVSRDTFTQRCDLLETVLAGASLGYGFRVSIRKFLTFPAFLHRLRDRIHSFSAFSISQLASFWYSTSVKLYFRSLRLRFAKHVPRDRRKNELVGILLR